MAGMTFELSREHEEFRRSVREFAEAEIAPHAAQWDRDHHFPVDVVKQMGKLGLFGLTSPEEYGGAGEDGDFTSLCVAIEEIDGRPVDGHHPRGGRRPRHQPDPHVRLRGAEEHLAAGPGRGRDARGLRSHRARCRLRRGRDEDPRRARQRRVGRERRQAVHHELRVRDHQRRRGHRTHDPDGLGRWGRAARDQRDPAAQRHARLHRREALRQARLARLDTHPLTFQDAHVPEANLLGERGRGYAQFLATLDDGRVAIAALAVGCIQACLDLSLQYAGERQTSACRSAASRGSRSRSPTSR